MMKPVKILIICCIITIICCLIYFLYQSSKELESNPKISSPMRPVKNFGDLRHLDVLKYPLPYANFETNVKFKEYSVRVRDCDVNILESGPNGSSTPDDNGTVPSARPVPPTGYRHQLTFLFLHGRSFTSKTWFDLKTMHLVSHMGHRALAVDLPGHGKTTCREMPNMAPSTATSRGGGAAAAADESERRSRLRTRSEFLDALIKRLVRSSDPESGGDYAPESEPRYAVPGVVLVSPSMSGSYSIPYVMFHARGAVDEVDEDDYRTVRAFVPIAPVGTEDFDFADYKSLHVPTLVVYGQLDTGLGLVSRRALEQIPTSVVAEIPAAGHACYLDQPAICHRVLYNFIRAID